MRKVKEVLPLLVHTEKLLHLVDRIHCLISILREVRCGERHDVVLSLAIVYDADDRERLRKNRKQDL